MLHSKLDPRLLRAAWWTVRALRATRRSLRTGAIDNTVIPRPPAVPAPAVRGVAGALRRLQHTCLERALVLQRWHAAHGLRRDVVVGVTSPQQGFTAHAWLDGDEAAEAEFAEVVRIPAQ